CRLPGARQSQPPAASPPPPAPTAAPSPTPVPTPNLPGATSCARVGPGQETGNICDRSGPNFEPQVMQAIAELQREQPSIFQETPGGTYIYSPGRFYVGLINKLDKQGLCAGFDSEELQVASNHGFNDQFALRTSRGLLRNDQSAYRATCFPAAIPAAPRPFPPNNGCKLAPSLELTCTREASHYLPDIEKSIDDVMAKHPEIFDFHSFAPGSTWPAVLNFDKYHEYIVQSMIAKGYCARFDGEEIAAKKSSDFNEQFDVFLGDGYVRRGEGDYRPTSYPAAF